MLRLLVMFSLLAFVAGSGAWAGETKVLSGRGESRLDVVFGMPDAPHALRVGADGAEAAPLPERTPLGSLWKLFVYAYLIDSPLRPADYQCAGRDRGEESYCCDPGGRIGRDAALVQSCGLYFQPQRLALNEADWRAYWQRAGGAVPDWLLRLEAMRPETEVSVVSLLEALAAIDEPTRLRTMHTLTKVGLAPNGRPLLTQLGSQVRVKTWSWRDAKGQRIGGFAGWLADGQPLWVRGSGTSATVIRRGANWLANSLPATRPVDEACVRVRFFARYPLAEVRQDGRVAVPGPLTGQVAARFANGQQLGFSGAPGLSLRFSGAQPVIEGRFALNEYIARVLQREGAVQPVAAARALAVAARTYLVNHADYTGGCYEIADDSHAQRVSPAPSVPAARAIAEWTDGLILSGVSGRYHAQREAAQQLSWQSAVRWANDGVEWHDILQRAYGNAGFSLVGETDGGECDVLGVAEDWLAARQAAWQATLETLPGFEKPSPLPHVCRLTHGNPYADLGRNRIYATGAASANDRLSLAHEYLHFALANHPNGRDEGFVERTARHLLKLP